MKISEIFYSLQGEGALVAAPAVFIRVAGCPLRCRWCDTKYAWDERAADDVTIEQICDTTRQWPCRRIVVTGGEPMTNSDLPQLIRALRGFAEHITIETAGIVYVPHLPCDLMSISPKLSNSAPPDFSETPGQYKRFDPDVLRRLISDYYYQLKFVIDCEPDLDEVLRALRQIGPVRPGRVFLMPQAASRAEFLQKAPMVAEMCKSTGLSFGHRLHTLLYNAERGK